jgi:hypothetical protein
MICISSREGAGLCRRLQADVDELLLALGVLGAEGVGDGGTWLHWKGNTYLL